MRPAPRRLRTHAQAQARHARLARAVQCFAAVALALLCLRALRPGGSTWRRGARFAFPAAALPLPPPAPAAGAAPPARRIPRLVHQTLRDPRNPPAKLAAALASWPAHNPGWSLVRYSDADAAAFVAAEFPEYAAAYAALPLAVERADFFRVLVLLRRGGVYADSDAACAAPLERALRPDDTLVVGWENAFDTAAGAQARHYVRQRQVLNWAFAAAPGHPALREAADAIAFAATAPPDAAAAGAAAAGSGARAANAAVLELTGPGAWTDAVLTWYARAAGGGGARGRRPVRDGFSARVLPRVAFGTHPRPGSADGVPQRAPEVVVAHAFAGGWKVKARVEGLPWPARPLLRPLARLAAAARGAVAAPPLAPQHVPFYPVSAAWAPPFDVLLPPPTPDADARRGAGASAAAHLLAWGAPPPRASPPPASPLLAPLLAAGRRGVLLDVGAGSGFYSLAAAASGAAAAAFEPHPPLRALLERAVAVNGLHAESLHVYNALFGSFSPAFCAAWRRLGGARGEGLRTGRAAPAAALLLPDTPCALPKGLTTLDAAAASAVRELSTANPGAIAPAPPLALRLAVGGWEGWVLDGATELMGGASAPSVVLIELHPRRLQHSGWGDARALWDRMAGWGYRRAAHAGGACDAALRRRRDEAAPPAWCVLHREAAARLARDVPRGAVEALLFMRDG